jgi:hypothetical protein
LFLRRFTTLFPLGEAWIVAAADELVVALAGDCDLWSPEEDLEKNPISCPQRAREETI